MSKGKKRGGSGNGFLFGVLLGMLAGVVLAILLAPQSGEETRAKLSEQSDLMRKNYGQALSQGREAYSRAREELLTRVKEPVETPAS